MDCDAVTGLRRAAQILEPVMSSAGFSFIFSNNGTGSGGEFACGDYVRNNRRLELHYRGGLGIVVYHIDQLSLPHRDYMVALGKDRESRWIWTPTRSGIETAQALKWDIEHFCSAFLSGPEEELRRFIEGLGRKNV